MNSVLDSAVAVAVSVAVVDDVVVVATTTGLDRIRIQIKLRIQRQRQRTTTRTSRMIRTFSTKRKKPQERMFELKAIRLIDTTITAGQRNKDGGMYVYYSNMLYYNSKRSYCYTSITTCN